MLPILTAQEMRALDRYAIEEFGIPALVLMENAGRSVLGEILRREKNRHRIKMVVVCGTGNNGGDGLVVARYAALQGHPVTILLMGGSSAPTAETKQNLSWCQKLGIPMEVVNDADEARALEHRFVNADVIVDALLGTGADRSLSPLYLEVIHQINRSPARVYSIDIPSGLHGETGVSLGALVKANVTIALGYLKSCFFLDEGPNATGETVVADLSFSDCWIRKKDSSELFFPEWNDVKSQLPARSKGSHKGTFGHVLVIAGSRAKSGASVLCSEGAVRAGAGLVTLALPESAHDIVKKQLVEVMTIPFADLNGSPTKKGEHVLHQALQGKTALVVGPGIEPSSTWKKWIQNLLLTTRIPVVVDADGLNSLGSDIRKIRSDGRLIVTPHPGEMARILDLRSDEVQRDRIRLAKELANEVEGTVILKGAFTVVSNVERPTWINPTGNPGLSTGGTGDVLAGLIAGLVAQGLTPDAAAKVGVYVHGLAADRRLLKKKGPRGMMARDLLDELPELLN